MRNPADVPVADRFVHKFSSDRAIDATANGADNATRFTAYLADARNLLSYKLFLVCATFAQVSDRVIVKRFAACVK